MAKTNWKAFYKTHRPVEITGARTEKEEIRRAGILWNLPPSERKYIVVQEEPRLMGSKELADLLRSAASALDHGRRATANKKLRAVLSEVSRASATGPVITVEGGVVQDVFVPDASQPKGFRELEYTIMDYDIFESETNEDIAEYWNNFPPELRGYIEAKLPHEFKLFQDRITEARKMESGSLRHSADL
jgi:hypothetical protein